MIGIKERDLKEVLKDFKNRDILIELNDGIEGSIHIKDGSVIYDEENGYINIIGKEQKLRLNTTVLYKYQISEDKRIFGVRVDGQIEMKIQKALDRLKF